jgi:hypothetical protein
MTYPINARVTHVREIQKIYLAKLNLFVYRETKFFEKRTRHCEFSAFSSTSIHNNFLNYNAIFIDSSVNSSDKKEANGTLLAVS